MKTSSALVLSLALLSCSRHDDQQAGQSALIQDRGVTQPPIANSIRDTVVEKSISIGESLPVGRVIFSVHVTPPHDSIDWNICAVVDNDTAFLRKGDGGWFKPDRQAGPSLKLSWYTRDFFSYQRDSIPVGDSRRRIFEKFLHEPIARYLRECGVAASAATAAETAFWTSYRDIPIITFTFSDFPKGGDQRAYAYHPTIRWFVPIM
jgi:hypothetical protein